MIRSLALLVLMPLVALADEIKPEVPTHSPSVVVPARKAVKAEADEQPIRMPISKQPPAPTAVTELATDSVFVIEADVPAIVLASRIGYVSISSDTGPVKMWAVFADGTGQIEKRTYTAKYLWIVEALKAGEVELMAIPVGATDDSKVMRRTLIVGHGPRPTPVPPVPPGPVPPDPPVPPTPIPTAFQVRLQSAFTADGSIVESARKLAALYRIASSTIVKDPAVTTGAALLGLMQTAVKNLGIPPGSMNATARVIADELNVSFANVKLLDSATRDKLAAVFLMISTSLEGVR